MKILTFSLFLLLNTLCFSQIFSHKSVSPSEEYKNVHVQKLHSDDRTTVFMIWVKEAVKAHRHESHTEVIVVYRGKGSMRVGTEVKPIKKGDIILVPMNTVHSVKTTSKKPLKVLSIQAPVFLGKDRIWVEEQ